jgi:hypothetical protein
MFWKRDTRMSRKTPPKNIAKIIRQKKDIIVAVRMPRGLLEELKDLQKINHFMDISDEIRFILRKYTITPSDPQINLELQRKDMLIKELTNIVEKFKNETK